MYFRKPATHKMMDLLAIREHSIVEIEKKLEEKKYAPEEIAEAIAYGKKHNWLPDSSAKSTALSEKLADDLGKKGKGQYAINQKLESMGLPTVKIDLESEMAKAIHLLEKKYRQQNLNDIKVKAKAVRFLAGKGFSEDCILESLGNFQTNTANDLE